jgi:hypothetical protein
MADMGVYLRFEEQETYIYSQGDAADQYHGIIAFDQYCYVADFYLPAEGD